MLLRSRASKWQRALLLQHESDAADAAVFNAGAEPGEAARMGPRWEAKY